MENQNESSLHIAYCINDKHVKYMCVSMLSVMENNKDYKIKFHIITNGLSKKNVKFIQQITNPYLKASAQLYNINDSILKGFETHEWTIYAWYRILLPLVLPNEIKQILYLDTDTLIVDDLGELINLDLQGKAVAGVLDVINFKPTHFQRIGFKKTDRYICSGVLLMNLDYWRFFGITNQIILWAKENKNLIKFPDQDSINVVCKHAKLVLPLRYGILNQFFLLDQFYEKPLISQLKECISQPAIIHYTCKPWFKDTDKHLFYSKWMEYNNKLSTPIRKTYSTKPGWLRFKIMIWNWLHPEGRQYVKLEDVINKLKAHEN